MTVSIVFQTLCKFINELIWQQNEISSTLSPFPQLSSFRPKPPGCHRSKAWTTSGCFLTCCHQMRMVLGIQVVVARNSVEAGQEEASLVPSNIKKLLCLKSSNEATTKKAKKLSRYSLCPRAHPYELPPKDKFRGYCTMNYTVKHHPANCPAF